MSGEAFCSLEGRVALVTGGARGIGAAVSRELRPAPGSRGQLPLGRWAGRGIAGEVGGIALQADVSVVAEAQSLVERVEAELGPIDVLVNNAGITRDTLIVRMSDEEWAEVIATNLNGVFHTCRAVARGMLKRRAGAIVNLTSVVGLHGNAGQTNYAASKAGIIGFTKSLAKELGGRGVRVNAVAPGYIQTELTDVLPDELKGLILQQTPLARLGEPGDVAGAVRFLCSDAARFVTGEVLLVDGGLGM
ncbi:MAG: SDR family oxidoreductase [Thermoleophilia bacterium]